MEFKIAGQLARMKLISDKETLSSALDATSGVHMLKAHLQVLNEEWKLFQEVNDYLGSAGTKEFLHHPYVTDDVYQVTYQSYQGARTALTALINQVDIPAPPAPVAQQNQSAPSTITLAPLNITVFSGDFTKWPEFRDMFTTHVINRNMEDVDRLHYLKNYLTGSAAQLVVNLPLSGDQFPIAWEAIRSRYEVPRLLIGAQLEKIIKIQPITPRSASQLNALINQVHEVVTALKAMKVEFSQGENHFLTYFIISKLDRVTREAWEHSLGSSVEFPTLIQLNEFLLERARAQERYEESTNKLNSAKDSSTPQKTHPDSSRLHRGHYNATPQRDQVRCHLSSSPTTHPASSNQVQRPSTATAQYPCDECQGDHFIVRCKRFASLTPAERAMRVVRLKLCPNCLGHHQVAACKSKFRCKELELPHEASLIHSTCNSTTWHSSNSAYTYTQDPPKINTHDQHNHTHHTPTGTRNNQHSATILATCLVNIITKLSTIPIRILLDSGSEISFISDSLVHSLNLTRTRSQLSVIGIGNAQAGRTKGCVELTLRSQHSSKTLNLHAHVLRGLTIQLPSVSISHNQFTQLQHLTLADPEFCTPGPINIIIGADYYGQVITGGLIQLEFPGLIAQHTLFEWIILGPTQHHTHQSRRSYQAAITQQDMNLQDLLTRFWVQEEIITTHQPQLTPDEEACEAHFARTHSRDSSGRYRVRLPLISPVHKLGDSFKAAYQCLRHLMHRLSKDPQLKQLYMEFMAEYISLNHMEPTTLRSSSVQYFLPHHGVLKQNTKSPKIRVVF
ncbi:uncharacterized protein LOC141533016 [Cotesia typhae]|uniref:uncharacterized protein LOC141533016 n=1 Tax=Cotesia typhae TaxID=2053667 RepID=UPI003D69B683